MLFTGETVEFKITFTTRCSGRCITCLNPKIEKHYTLERELFENIIAEIIDLNIPQNKVVSFYSIGESYLHPEYIEMCEWAIPLLHENNIKTMLVTNGTHMNRVPLGIDTFIVSFNAGKKETYENITGVSFEKVYRNIQTLYTDGEFSKANEVQIHMLCFDENKGEEEYFISLFSKLKNVKYRFRYGYDNQYENTEHKGRERQYFQPLKRIPCNYVTSTVTIYPNGDITRCSHDFFDKYPYGNLYHNSMQDILNSELRNTIFNEHLNGIFSDICDKCDFNRDTLENEFQYGYFVKEENELFQRMLVFSGDYYKQLTVNKAKLINKLENKKKILLWGIGKRGKAFIEFCKNNHICIYETYDKQLNDNNVLISILNECDIIVASTYIIYNLIQYNYTEYSDKAVNLEKYCPIN